MGFLAIYVFHMTHRVHMVPIDIASMTFFISHHGYALGVVRVFFGLVSSVDHAKVRLNRYDDRSDGGCYGCIYRSCIGVSLC